MAPNLANVPTPPMSPRVDSITSTVLIVGNELHEIAARIGNLSDRLFGPQPRAGSVGASNGKEQPAQVDQLERAVGSLGEPINTIRDFLTTLERL